MTILVKCGVAAISMMLLQVKTCKEREVLSLDTADYITWIENPDNGLVVNKDMNGLVFSLQYKPYEYEVMLQEKRALQGDEMHAIIDSISDMQYYTFRIATESGTDVQRYLAHDDQEYYARLEYFSLQMQNDIALIDGNDTLPCLMFHYERTYGIDPRATFVMAFNAKQKSTDSKTLLFTDRVFGSGPVLLTIESSSLQQIPQLYLPE